MGKESEVFEACRDGNLTKLQHLLAEKSRKLPFSLSKNGTPLTQCKEASSGSTPLHYAALNGHEGVVEFLLNNKADIRSADARGCLPLHLASWNGLTKIVQLLVQNDSSRSTINALTNNNETSLIFAAQYGHTDVVRLLIKFGADPTLRNASGESALDLAAKNGRKEIVEHLIAVFPQLVLNNGNNIGCSSISSPLHLAAKNGKTDIVRVLLDAGFDINFLTEDGTALHSASLFGKIDVVKLLLERGVNVDAKDFNGRTVLDILEEHRTRKSGSLSQSLKHLDVWQSCVELIEKVKQEKVQKTNDVSTTSSPYLNGAACVDSSVWMALPPDCAERLAKEQKEREEEQKIREETASAVGVNNALTVRTDLAHLFENDSVCSTISLTPDGSPLPMSPNNTLEQRSNTNNNFSPSQKKPKKLPRKICSYQVPPLASCYDNVPLPGPATGYDNVPSNAIGYDNAPTEGGKVWTHDCNEDCRHEDGQTTRRVEETFIDADLPISSRIESPRSQESPKNVVSPKPRVTWVGNYDNVPETVVREIRSPSTPTVIAVSSPPEQIIDKTIQLIERTSSDIKEECQRQNACRSPVVVVGGNNSQLKVRTSRPRDLSCGSETSTCSSLKAPLAQFDAEDLGTSAEGDVFVIDSRALSPTSPSQVPPVKTPSEPPPSVLDSESKISKKIRPSSAEELVSVDESRMSPSKPTKQRRLLLVDGETQVESTSSTDSISSSGCCESGECSCSGGSKCSLLIERADNSNVSVFIDDSEQQATSYRSPTEQVQTRPNRSKVHGVVSPIDEQAEWKKIEEIFQSYGSAISRLSMFDTEIQPVFTNYLKSASANSSDEQQRTTSPSRRVVERWLASIGLLRYAKTFYDHGFDRLEFLKHTLDSNVLRAIGIVEDVESILNGLANLPVASATSTCLSNFRYVSDWLHALGCQDCLVYFARRRMDSVQDIILHNFTEDDLLNVVGVPLIGYRRRLAWSIANSDSSNSSPKNKTGSTLNSPSSSLPAWRHSSDALLGNGITYVGHYLGSTELRDDRFNNDNNSPEMEDVRRTELTRKAIGELKEKMRDNAKIPEIILQIRYKGVRLLDTKTQQLLCEHLVQNIHCVCQDERDMNCFAYNTKDGTRHFCHVFSVFTSDLAREIILTLGQAFEVAYQKALESGRV